MRRVFCLNVSCLRVVFLIACSCCFGNAIKAQNVEGNTKLIQGVVRDNQRVPLLKVIVTALPSQKSAFTDLKGNFKIAVNPTDTVLEISQSGYNTLDTTIGNNNFFNLTLSSVQTGQLSDVVVIAYGTTTTRGVSNAVVTLGAKDIANKPVTNALQALQGLAAGVNIQQNVGTPGQAPQIKIRGMGSIGAGNNPLYVVDGIPLANSNNFNQINPADIESINILKDAAAAAMYGSRGGNGVVLVTTKKGKAGKNRFDVNAYAGTQHISKYVDVLNRDQYVDFVKDAFTNGGLAVPSILSNPSSLPNTNWQKAIFRTAPMSNIQIATSGGTDKVNYYASAFYTDQEGILKNTGYKVFGLNTNLTITPLPWLKMGLYIAPSYSSTQVQPAQGAVNSAVFTTTFGPNPNLGSPISQAILAPPIIPMYLSNGKDFASFYNWPETGPTLNGILSFNGQQFNPLQTLTLYKDRYNSFRGLTNAYLQVELMKGLTLKTSLSAEYQADQRKWFIPGTLAYNTSSFANITTPNLVGVQNTLAKGNNYSWTWENTLAYKKSFNNHNFDVILGYAAQKAGNEGISVQSQSGSATNATVQYPTNTSQTILGNPFAYGTNALASMFGRLQYNYKYKYLLSAAIRRDGSSRFGSDNKYASFPSFSAGWDITKEDFFRKMDSKNIFSMAKFRASWGKTGNYNIGDFSWQGLMNQQNYSFGNGGIVSPGFGQGSFILSNLTWETNKQTDIGLDLGVLNNRIMFNVDYYNRITENLLLNAKIPAIIGFATSSLANVGSVRNRGWEFAINTHNFVKEFVWSTNFNISFNRNKILALNAPVNFDAAYGYSNSIRNVVGGSIGDFYGYKQIGVYMNQNDLNNSAKWGLANPSAVGDIKYQDVNGDGVINTNDIIKIGTPQPNFIYGLVNNFAYKNFDLAVTMQGVNGGNIANVLVRYSNTYVGGNNPLSAANDRWRSDSDPGNGMVPRAVRTSNAPSPAPLAAFSSRNLYSASYLRMSNVTLGYNFTNKIFKGKDGKSARVYISGNNIFTTSKYPGYNPDVNTYGYSDATMLNVDQGAYPLARTFIIGLNLGL